MYGYVVDIGTSKLVGVLVDLVAGEALNTLFVENPGCLSQVNSRRDWTPKGPVQK